jgi:hypothetical protein
MICILEYSDSDSSDWTLFGMSVPVDDGVIALFSISLDVAAAGASAAVVPITSSSDPSSW